MTFSEISKSLRKEKGLSQIELAKALNISKACISMIEIGKNEPTANTLSRYADFFEVSTDYLLGREDDFGVINIPVKEKSADVLSTEERKLIETYRKLNAKNQMHVGVYATLRLEEQEETKKTV